MSDSLELEFTPPSKPSILVPSKYQKSVFDCVRTGTGNAMIEAVAGSGKTTTIIEALKLVPSHQSVVFLAFNKSIAQELQARVPSHVQASTLNSLGHRAWMRHCGSSTVTLDTKKTLNILKAHRGKYSPSTWEDLFPAVKKMVGYAKAEGIVPEDMGLSGLEPDNYETWEWIMDHHDIYFGKGNDDKIEQALKNDAIILTRQVLKESIHIGNKIIDFDDQLYLTVINDVKMNQYDWVFVDEAQDISGVQRALVTKALRRGGRLFAVGDSHQSIYGFRGADSESMENLAKQFNPVRLPLSISYRCPKAVVREAKQIVPHIESSDTAPEGSVERLGVFDTVKFDIGSLAICRYNAPIVKLAYQLIRSRTPVRIIGKDIGSGLVALITKLNASSVGQLSKKIIAWHRKELAKRVEKDPEADCSDIDDKLDVIMVFIEEAKADTVLEICNAIDNLFSKASSDKVVDPGLVNLSTIHKSKGLEADTVYFIDRDKLPSKRAKKVHHIQQENNLIYVGVTRAKRRLCFVTSPESEEERKAKRTKLEFGENPYDKWG